MMRLLAGLAMALVIGLLVTTSQAAEDKTHDGLVVSAAEGKLVMTDNDGKNEHSHMIDTLTKVTLDGKAAKITDLKKGDKIKVTTSEGNKVTAVAATRSKSP